MICHNCGREVDAGAKPGRADACPFCGSDLRCCSNCRFFEPGAYNQCLETQAERVVEKDRSNFCDYFQLNNEREIIKEDFPKKQNPLDSLFKK